MAAAAVEVVGEGALLPAIKQKEAL